MRLQNLASLTQAELTQLRDAATAALEEFEEEDLGGPSAAPVEREDWEQHPWPRPWMLTFLRTLRREGFVTLASIGARITRTTAYDWKERDEAFAAAWEEAVEESGERLEQEAFRRAYHGVPKGVYHQGERIAIERVFSDTLLNTLLRARFPKKYRDNSTVEHTGNLTLAQRIMEARNRVGLGGDE